MLLALSIALNQPTARLAWGSSPAVARFGGVTMTDPPPTSQRRRREQLLKDLEMPDSPRQPDGPAEDDPFAPMAYAASRAGDARKAKDISALRVSHLTSATNFFVNMVGSSKAQINAIVRNVEDEMKECHGMTCLRQGKAMGGWVCLDYDAVVVNIFSEAQRDFYGIEKYWAAAQVLDLSNVLVSTGPEAAVDAASTGDDWETDDWELEPWTPESGLGDWNLDDVDSATTDDADSGTVGSLDDVDADAGAEEFIVIEADAPVPFDWSVPPPAAPLAADLDEDDVTDDEDDDLADDLADVGEAQEMEGILDLPDDPAEAEALLERELAELDDGDDDDEEGVGGGAAASAAVGGGVNAADDGGFVLDDDDDDLFGEFGDDFVVDEPPPEATVATEDDEELVDAAAAAAELLDEFEGDDIDEASWALGDERLRAIVERAERTAIKRTAGEEPPRSRLLNDDDLDDLDDETDPPLAGDDADDAGGGWRSMMAEDGFDADAEFTQGDDDDDDDALDNVFK